jgi:hypothetical protein
MQIASHAQYYAGMSMRFPGCLPEGRIQADLTA